ncbi:uncharacterized protein LOC108668697 [Hyalella azteca]|uniref:Uncharacterized protein LOC108668697 n=1 Tax=Hyalella azteca TaxID=294128 RepID=A0A8B7ND25_HYAAZ|nr:uncharacterized protein LOC108668697 [Hyalella azteca]
METSVKKLEILFGEAEQQLSVLSTKVDAQCCLLDQSSVSADTSDNNSNASLKSITSVVGCVKDLRSELLKVAADVATLQEQQQQVMQSITSELLALSENYASLPHLISRPPVHPTAGAESPLDPLRGQ